MNALANSQHGELEKLLQLGDATGQSPVTFARLTVQESEDERKEILDHPPDMLLTNYVMLELILTRRHAAGLTALRWNGNVVISPHSGSQARMPAPRCACARFGELA
jgi:ATP-dependent helicase YprA (DUF1998 family)